ncbi:putative membrane transporter protein [Gammaproteobacteria bacterium]
MTSYFIKDFLIIFIGFFTGFFTSTTGAASLMLIPLLSLFGYPIVANIATVRVCSFLSMVPGLFVFHRANQVNYKVALYAAIFSSVGAVIGAIFIINASTVLVKYTVAGLIVFAFLIWFLKDKISCRYKFNGLVQKLKHPLFILPGLLGGTVGGQAILSNIILVPVFKQTYLMAAGTRKIIGLVTAVIPIMMFASSGTIDWKLCIELGVPMLVGSYFGAIFGLKKGENFVKALFFTIAFLALLKMVFVT